MRRLVVMPDGWLCTIAECRPGHFIWNGLLCFKTEYGGANLECFNEAGEALCGYDAETRVQPVDPVWEDYEE